MLDKTIIDIDDALKRALGDAAFLKMMFDEFQQMVPEFVDALEKAIENNDADSLDRTAHQMKGAAANLGILSISSIALNLEKMGKSGHTTGAGDAFEQLKSAISGFDQQLALVDWAALGG